jgi:hypothetical protein
MVGYGPDAGFAAINVAADFAARVTGWDEEQRRVQIERHVAYMQRFLPAAQTS